MPTPVTIDASVFVRAANLSEPGHGECANIIAAVGLRHLVVIEPTLLTVEVAAALGRRGSSTARITAVLERLVRSPVVTLVPLDEALAAEAAELAVAAQLRGADAVYVATARRYGSTLITADDEQLLRAEGVVPAMVPSDFLASMEDARED
jgi:predicted nucleic acid-binding protein